MRVIAGTERGRVIECPDGSDTRPTIDRVRESIMSAVYSCVGGFEGRLVLDLFAGSGALGIESLSRGCDFATFNDSSAQSRKCIERNLKSLGYSSDRASITSVDALAGIAIQGPGPFDIVFLDPPYATPQKDVFDEVKSLIEKGCIANDALMVYEHDEKTDVPMLESRGFSLLKEKGYGNTFVSYFETRRARD